MTLAIFQLKWQHCRRYAQEWDTISTSNAVQINSWDDHDIFDGWGSYPPELNTCHVFNAVFREAQRMYLLFQQGTTPALAEKDGFIINQAVAPTGSDTGLRFTSYHYFSQLGPHVACTAPDTRSQRSRLQILPVPARQRILLKVCCCFQ